MCGDLRRVGGDGIGPRLDHGDGGRILESSQCGGGAMMAHLAMRLIPVSIGEQAYVVTATRELDKCIGATHNYLDS